MIKNFASSPATAKAPLSQRGFITRAARRQRKDGAQPAASLFTTPPAGNPVVPVVKAGQIIRPQPDAEQKCHDDIFEPAPASKTVATPKPKRTPKGVSEKALMKRIRLTDARALLFKVAASEIEFQRRVVLVKSYDVCREMGLSGNDFARRVGVWPASLQKWSQRAKERGFDSLRPWEGRAMTAQERDIIEGK